MDGVKLVSQSNETMELIDRQPTDILNEEVFRRFEDVASVKPKSFSFAAAVDIFLLGYYYGSCAK